MGVRHEQTAAYAADGYARATGRLGVALTTTGPGAANTLGAVGEAWASRQPILVIATDIPTTARRPGVWRGVLHEATDQAAMFAPVVKKTLQGALRAASWAARWRRRSGRRSAPPTRPVYVEVPTDLLDHEAPTGPGAGRAASRAGARTEAPLDQAAEALAHARRPLIWAGGGAIQAGAGEAVARLAERLVAPVIAHLLGPRPARRRATRAWSRCPRTCPRCGALWDEADVVVVVGSDLDAMMTQGFAPAPAAAPDRGQRRSRPTPRRTTCPTS